MLAANRDQISLWHRSATRRRGAWACALALAAGLVAAGPGSAGAEEGPVVIGGQKERKFRFLDFDRPELTLETTMLYATGSFSGNSESSSSKNLVFEETAGLRTSGYIVSPSFFEMSLAGLIGLQQSQTNVDSTTGVQPYTIDDRSDQTIYEYDVRGTLRRESILPVSAYATRSQELVNRTFSETMQSTFNSYGVDVSYNSRILPSSFRLYHQDNTQTSLGGVQDFSTSTDAFEWHTQWQPTSSQSLTWDYRLTQGSQVNGDRILGEASDSTSSQSQDATLIHSVAFGANRAANLTSSLNYSDQTGDFAQERLQLDERFHVQHNKTFETNWFYRYFDTTYQDVEQIEQNVRANFVHRLFSSVVTSGNIGARFLDMDNGASQSNEQYADLDTTYTKNVPLGVLTLNAHAALSQQQNDAQVAPVEVLDEPHTFNNYQPIILSQQFLDPNSIRITNKDNTFTYRKNVDYTVRSFPGRIEIWPRPGGIMGPVVSTLIDYTLNPQPANNASTDSFSFGASYEFTEGTFKGFGVFAGYLMQDQTIDSAQADSFVPDNIRELTLRAHYNIWKLIFTAEYKDHESTLSPYTETRLDAQFQHRTKGGTNLTLDVQYQIYDYPSGAGERLDILTASGSLDQQFSSTLHGSLNASYIQEQIEGQGSIHGTDVELRLDWKYRQTQVYGTVRHSTLNTEDSDSSFMLFQVGIKRTF